MSFQSFSLWWVISSSLTLIQCSDDKPNRADGLSRDHQLKSETSWRDASRDASKERAIPDVALDTLGIPETIGPPDQATIDKNLTPQEGLVIPDACVSEDDMSFCLRQNRRCGSITGSDNCGTVRTASCGDCFCNGPIGSEEACIDVNEPGNLAAESLVTLWPLSVGNAWKYHGISRAFGDVFYKLQIKIENELTYEGQLVMPVDFVKNDPAGYWDPGNNFNLRWMVVNWNQSGLPFQWAQGDQAYDRDTKEHYRRHKYEALFDPGNNPSSPNPNPPYALLPQTISPNPTNDGLANYIATRHQYPKCYGPADCTLVWDSTHFAWFANVTNARVLLPYSGGAWVNAKRVEFVELSLPNGIADLLSDPYSPNRNFACRLDAGGGLYYRGVREDWYFVDGLGPALIITRGVGQLPDNECIHEVAREELTFDNCDTYSYLVRFDTTGFDNYWNF
jgi:hypothetical protein